MADTRRQILLTIKEQLKLHSEPVLDPSKQHRWSPQQWWESFTFLFVNHSSAGHHQQDDLLFFVRQQQTAAGSGSPGQVFVRRKTKQLPEELQLTGKAFSTVDWVQTVLLNLVLHSEYQLTVVACGPEGLPFVAEGRTWSPGMISVTRPVYASTTVTAVNLDSSRAKDANPQPCYPDICFAVDNFDNTFEDLVLEDVSRCYCVVLHAVMDMHDHTAADAQQADLAARLSSQTRLNTDGSEPPGQQHQQAATQQHTSNGSANGSGATAAAAVQQQSEASDAVAPAAAPARHSSTDESGSSAWQIGTHHKRTLFAGYVSFQQIQDFMDSSSSSRNGRSLLDSWLKGPKAPLQDKVVMTGPGGMGRCEVAVTKLEQQAAPSGSSSSSSLAAQQGSVQRGGGQQAAMQGDAQQQQQQQPQEQQRGAGQGLLQRGLQRARVVASGVQQALDVLSELQPSPAASHMLCALMTLRLPVHYLAQELLAAV